MITFNTNIEEELKLLGNKVNLLTSRNISYMVARAMTETAKEAQKVLKQSMSRYIEDGPVPFTVNSTFVRFAKPSDLSVEVGFKQFASKGTAAGRYLQPMAAGGTRPAKSTERQLRNAGLLRPSEFIVPADVTPLKLNNYGNITGGKYTQMLSRLKSFGEQGYQANIASNASKEKRNYFIGTPGGLPRGIYARVGRKKRGFHTVFYITRAPKYSQTFPIVDILNAAYAKAWKSQLQTAFSAELGSRIVQKN